MRACSEAVPLYPVYALLFADTGLTTAQVSSLFALWSVVAFAAEVPSGALADAWSRKRLYALGELLTAVGYLLWVLWPSYAGFAVGFVLWGLGGSLSSGSLEALLYDELAAEGRADDYARLAGRGNTLSILAMLAATLVATPAWQWGGYVLVGALSVAAKVAGAALALRLPENRPSPASSPAAEPDSSESAGPDSPGFLASAGPDSSASSASAGPDSPGSSASAEDEGSYWSLLRGGVREAVGSRRVGMALLVAALIPGFTALDEYLPLLSRDKGASTAAIPLLYAVTALAMAAGSALAARPFPLIAALPMAAALLAGGALAPPLAGMIAVSAAFGVLEYSIIRAETRLQDTISGPARSTVLSVAGFGGELFAVVLYAAFALPLQLPLLFTLCAAPLLLTALIARR
ncbi:MFS transporter [Actinoplanes sp. Pm04-4]|uniref:MFS transporter n=1 Tax=Paractinoplanes pyxinae TaxID=2997416 RepID=A0ABT4B884_9ACTN|nr:MFS transporter [Actinoplanes pyxinae]MCY1141810.1 MFS transporter [Actinoplanes pyxinae]